MIDELLSNPESLIERKPFYRGTIVSGGWRISSIESKIGLGQKTKATLPRIMRREISQDSYIQELDPDSHKVLFDDNIPKITIKAKGGGYQDIEYKRLAVPWQKIIRDKHVLHLCGNKTQFTLMNENPSERENLDFITFKQYWDLRNMDGLRTKMVETQKSYGDAGLLFYSDYNDCIKARILSYADGYVLCPHNDENGDRILESVYYANEEGEFIDSYDDTYMYRYACLYNDDSVQSGVWQMTLKEPHGFSEIPLITHRGQVAWDAVQSTIEVYEVIYNIFTVIQKRYGTGILYIKGTFKDKGKRLAGNIILNDTSVEGKGSAEFKTPPSPMNMLETLDKMEETIQKSAGATILLPKDVKSSGDISALAIMLTQSRDIETATQGAIEWQNVISKMQRLFSEGLSKELVKKGDSETAVTDFQNLRVFASFKIWRPHSDTEYNSMIIQLKQSGCISEETAIERNTESSPDEKMRRKKERENEQKIKEEEAKKNATDKGNTNIVDVNSTTIKENGGAV